MRELLVALAFVNFQVVVTRLSGAGLGNKLWAEIQVMARIHDVAARLLGEASDCLIDITAIDIAAHIDAPW